MIGLPKTFVARGSVLSLGMQGFSKLVALGVTILLARVLSAADFGTYSAAIAWMSVGTMVALLGLQQSAVRIIVAYNEAGERQKLRGFLRYAVRGVLLMSVLVAAVCTGLMWQSYDVPQASVLLWVVPLLMCNSISELQQSLLGGFKKVARALLPKHVFYPLVMAAALAVYALVHGELTLVMALMATCLGLFAAVVTGAYWLKQCWPKEAADEHDAPAWRRAMRWNMLHNGVIALQNNAGVIALSIWVGVAEAALFAIAMRFFDVMAFIQRAMTLPLSAGLAEQRDSTQIRFSRAAWLSVLFSAPFVVLFAAEGQWLLTWIFGTLYGEALVAVMIVISATMVTAACGPCGVLLVARGFDKVTALWAVLSVAVGLLVLAMLMHDYGAVGAALAFFIGSVLNNVGAAWLAYYKTGIVPSILGKIR